jgi:ribonuclease-3 family protein
MPEADVESVERLAVSSLPSLPSLPSESACASLAKGSVLSPFHSWLAAVITAASISAEQASEASTERLPAARVLAHLGDAVYELLIRQWLLSQPIDWSSQALHEATIQLARMETQACIMEALLPELSTVETDVFKLGRNQPIPAHRRKHQVAYRLATGFEALVGYWWVREPQRLFLLEPHLQRLQPKPYNTLP